MRISRILLLLLFAPPLCFAQAPELLIPVTGSEAATILAKNHYFVSKHLYVAKRHRLVRVNTDALLKSEKIRISLFDDLALTFEVTKLEVSPARTINWRGRLADPPVSPKDLMVTGSGFKTLEEAESYHHEIFGISISAELYRYFPKSDLYTVYGPENNPSGNRNPRCIPITAPPDSPHPPVYGARTKIYIPYVGEERFRLKPLELTPNYHLLIQVDSTKTAGPGPLVDPTNPIMAARRQEYRTFLQALGPDPRDANFEAFLQSVREANQNCIEKP
jgi:hypothetical protein